MLSKGLLRGLQFIVYILSYLAIRNKTIWVFGSFSGFTDNSRYLFEYLYENPEREIKAIWISKDKKSLLIVKEFGYKAYYKWSLKGIYYSLRAGVYIFSGYSSDINFFTSGRAYLVNLWHGTPLKKIEFDIRTKPLVNVLKNASLLMKFKSPQHQKRPDLVLSPSVYVANYSLISAFRLKGMENILLGGYPRVINLLDRVNNKRSLVEKKNYVFFYAPTWRDSGGDFIASSGINFKKLDLFLIENNAVMKIKLHPETKLTCCFDEYNCIEFIPNTIDINEPLSNADCLITDYSSVYFDYLYLGRPIIFFIFDYYNYVKEREMYFELDDNMPGMKCSNFEHLINAMSLALSKEDYYSLERMKIHNLFNAQDNLSYSSLVNDIMDRVNTLR